MTVDPKPGADTAADAEDASATKREERRFNFFLEGISQRRRVAVAGVALLVTAIPYVLYFLSDPGTVVNNVALILIILLAVAVFVFSVVGLWSSFKVTHTRPSRDYTSGDLFVTTDYTSDDLFVTTKVEKPSTGALEIELPTELLGRRTPFYPLAGGLVGLLGGAAAAFGLGSGVATTVFCLVFVVFGIGGVLYGLYLLRDRRAVLDAVQTLLDTYRVTGRSKSQPERIREVLSEQLFALRRSGDHRLAAQILDTLDPPAAYRSSSIPAARS